MNPNPDPYNHLKYRARPCAPIEGQVDVTPLQGYDTEASWGTDYLREHMSNLSVASPDPFTRQPLPIAQLFTLQFVPGMVKDSEGMTIRFGKLLGKGKFGSVWEATVYESSCNGQVVPVLKACKVIRFRLRQGIPLENNLNLMVRDVNTIAGLSHANIISIERTIPVPDSVTNFPYSALVLILELCHGDLIDVLSSSTQYRQKLPPSSCKRWLKDIAKGVQYLHRHYVAHMDIKPENILFRFHKSGLTKHALLRTPQLIHEMIFKLTDFGISVRFGPGVPMLTKVVAGTPQYMAPEMQRLRQVSINQRKFVNTKPCDVFSLGMTLAHMYVGQPKFYGYNAPALISILQSYNQMTQIWTPNVNLVSTELTMLITQMINPFDPISRPTIDVVLTTIEGIN